MCIIFFAFAISVDSIKVNNKFPILAKVNSTDLKKKICHKFKNGRLKVVDCSLGGDNITYAPHTSKRGKMRGKSNLVTYRVKRKSKRGVEKKMDYNRYLAQSSINSNSIQEQETAGFKRDSMELTG